MPKRIAYPPHLGILIKGSCYEKCHFRDAVSFGKLELNNTSEIEGKLSIDN